MPQRGRSVVAAPLVDDVLGSRGGPLEPGAREATEERFGHEFGSIRVHTDERAGEPGSPMGRIEMKGTRASAVVGPLSKGTTSVRRKDDDVSFELTDAPPLSADTSLRGLKCLP